MSVVCINLANASDGCPLILQGGKTTDISQYGGDILDVFGGRYPLPIIFLASDIL